MLTRIIQRPFVYDLINKKKTKKASKGKDFIGNNFNRRSFNATAYTLRAVLSGAAVFGLPECCASSLFARLRFNSSAQCLMVVNDGTYSASCRSYLDFIALV